MKKTKIILPIFAGLALLGAATSAVVLSKDKAQQPAPSLAYASGEVKDPFEESIFYIDEKLNVTAKDIVYNGHLVTSYDFYVIYPDGSQKSGSEHRLSQTGEYSIVYVGKEGDVIVKAEEKIYAYNQAYSVGKEGSYTNYTEQIKGMQVIPGKQEETPGVHVTLVEGDTWTFNQAIDISKADLTKPIITYFTRQMSELYEHMSCDVDSVTVRLTDYYDPTNYVDIRNTYNCTNNSTGRLQPYVLAGANGQTLSGIDPANRSSRTVNYNGMTYYLHTGNAWGACLDTVPGMNGIFGDKYNPDIANSDNRGYSLYYNYADSVVYMHHRDMHVVTDLDETAIYSNSLFGGFTTGEVIVSMRCDGYNEGVAEFEISEIFGLKGEDLNRKYSYDENAPIINLTNDANNFKIAKGEEFAVFHAVATDPNLVGEVTTEVFFDYGSTNERYIPLVDGKFVPNYVGEYTIRYSARDLYGNVAEKLVVCNCINTEHGKIVELDFNAPATVEAGSYLTINVPKVTGYNDGLYVEAVLNYKDGEADIEEIDLDNPTILVKRVGAYELDILYGDVSCGKIARYPLESTPSDNAYLENTTFAKYFIKGAITSLEDNKTVLCNSKEIQYASSDVYVNEDGKGYGTSPIDPFSYQVDASSSVQFKYVYNDKVIFESDVIDVIDVNFVEGVDMSKYFVGDMDVTSDVDRINFIATSDSSSKEVEFINPLAFSILRLNIEFDTATIASFKSFDITMKDYYGKEKDFVMSFYFVASSLNVKINGVNSEIGVTDSIILSYDDINKSLGLGNGLFLALDNPFVKDKLYMSFKYEGLNDECRFSVKSINNQNMTVDNFDFFNPQVSYSRLKGQRNINETITIRQSIALDVLSPYLLSEHKVIVTYKDKDGKTSTVSSTDGILLNGNENPNRDYDVLLDKYGTYTITYKYADQAYSYGELQENRVSVSEVIYVNDNEAPVITIDGVGASTVELANLGDEINVHSYSVSDQSAVTVVIYAFSPMGGIVEITDNMFVANYVGDWSIVYFAVDANNNVSSASYIVRVK